MLLKGLPLYHLNVQNPGFEFFIPLDPVEQKRQDILNDLDYEDYAVSSKLLKVEDITSTDFAIKVLIKVSQTGYFF